MAKKHALSPAFADYNPHDFPPFAVTADIAIFTLTERGLEVALVKRGEGPFKGCWALPGGFVKPDESLDQAAARELEEETGLRGGPYLEQLGAFGAPDRDPRMRVVTVCYVAAVPNLPEPEGGGDAARAELVPVSRVLSGRVKLAFDHREIFRAALEHVRGRLEDTPIATAFCGEVFSLKELHEVYKHVWGVNDKQLNLANFRRKVVEKIPGFLAEAEGTRQWQGRGRPGKLYRKGKASRLNPQFRRAG
jgi:8-oxo-dGTP diphosphatase